jgi:type I restriction enzyme S subunit
MSKVTVRLADVVDINPRTSVDATLESVAFVAMADVTEGGQIAQVQSRSLSEVSKGYTVFQNDDVLLAKITPCFENGKAAHVSGLFSGVGFGSTEFHVLRPSSGVDGRFLLHLIWNPLFRRQGAKRMTGSAGQKRVPTAFLADLEFELPSMSEQKRIAAILDKSDSLRRKRQDAIRLVDDLLRSTLLTCLEQPYDAFGVEQLLSMKKNAIRTGPFGSQLLHAEFTESGVPVLGIDNVVTNRFRWDERRYISAEKYEQLSRYTVYPGDVMVTIMGTTGRVAVAPDDLPICISTKHLCTMTVDRTKILPEFLWACLLWDPAVRAQSSRESKGAIMDGLNMGIVKGLQIKVPSMDVQQRFVSVLRKVDALRSKYKVAVDDGASLNAALTSKLLAGSSQH